jgi:hypothetical protein
LCCGVRHRSEKDAAKRQAKLDTIGKQVEDGSLTVRTMTDAEKKKFGIGDPDRPFKRFFVPGARAGSRRAETEYQDLSRAVRKATGKVPVARRIFRLDKLEVGENDEHGDVVLAIFDLGKGEPFAVCTDASNDHPAYRVKAPEKVVVEFS